MRIFTVVFIYILQERQIGHFTLRIGNLFSSIIPVLILFSILKK